MTQSTAALVAGALDHLIRHSLTGCGHSARVAAHLLDQLAGQPDVDGATRCLCDRMSEALEAGQGRVGGGVMCERHASSPSPGPSDHPLPPAEERRRTRLKLWELEEKYHCPVIGTCLTLADLERLARNTGNWPSAWACA